MQRAIRLTLLVFLASLPAAAHAADDEGVNPEQHLAALGLDRLPLAFEANVGQFDKRVRFVARGRRETAFLTDQGLVLVRRDADSGKAVAVRVALKDVARRVKLEGADLLPGRSNYFVGNKRKHWHTDVPRYARVVQHGAYPGIDVSWYQGKNGIEYDLIVAAGADPSQVQLAIEGADRVELDDGDLVMHTPLGPIRQHKPLVYQGERGALEIVDGRYALAAHGRVAEVRFELGAYDPERALVLDPVLDWGSYVGGDQFDFVNGIAVDTDANVFVGGNTSSDAATFPETVGAYQVVKKAFTDAFVGKISADGTQYLYVTYLGGGGNDFGRAIAVDSSGQAVLAGETGSDDFPLASAFQGSRTGGTCGTVTKLNAAGNGLVFSTYFGGNQVTRPRGVAVDSVLATYVTGVSFFNTTFPTSPGAFQTTPSGATKTDAFVAKFNSNGTRAYATLVGSGGEAGNSISVDAAGSAYVVGTMVLGAINSVNATTIGPTDNAIGSVMLAKLNSTGTALTYLTKVGSTGGEEGIGGAVDANGNLFFTGRSYKDPPGNSDLPSNTPAPTGTNVALFGAVNAAGSALTGPGLTWYGNATATACQSPAFTFGAIGSSIALDPTGNAAYVAGYGCPVSKLPVLNPVPGLSCSPNCSNNTNQLASFLLRYTFTQPAGPLADTTTPATGESTSSVDLQWAQVLGDANAEYFLQSVVATLVGNAVWGGSTEGMMIYPRGFDTDNNGEEDGTVIKIGQNILPPEVTKQFLPPVVPQFQVVAIPITITNPNESTELTHVTLGDTFGSCLYVLGSTITPQPCGKKLAGPTVTTGQGGAIQGPELDIGFGMKNAKLAPKQTCTVVVFAQALASCTNTTTAPTSDQGNGTAASANVVANAASIKAWAAQNPQKTAGPEAVTSVLMSEGANWTGGVAPADGDNVTFPGTATQLAVTNDLPVNQTFNLVTIGGSGYTLGGNTFNLKAGVRNTAPNNTFSTAIKATLPIGLTSDGVASALTLSGIDLNGKAVYFAGSGAINVNGAIGGNGDVSAGGTGDLTLSVAPTYTGTLRVEGGRLFANAAITQAIDVLGSGVLRGSGSLGTVLLEEGGVVFPGTGAAPATFALSNLTVEGGTVEITFSAGNAAHGALAASGTVALSGGTLRLDLTSTPSNGTVFTNLVTAPGTITGCFESGTTNLQDLFVVPQCTSTSVSGLIVQNTVFSNGFETP